jgi:hypothetical protein
MKEVESMNAKKTFAQKIVTHVQTNGVILPWTRGAHRRAFIARRMA